MPKLTAKAVTHAKPGTHHDGGGLLLKVTADGARRWVLRRTVNGRRPEFGLGSASQVTLAQARDAAAEMTRAIRNGEDPRAARRAAREGTMTFKAAALKVHATRKAGWTNGRHVDQWLRSMQVHAFPRIGNMAVADIRVADVQAVLEPIWLRRPETSRRLKQRMATVLAWASASGFRSENLANAALAVAPILPKQPKQDAHHEAMPWQNILAFITVLRTCDSRDSVKLGLEFLILTAARTNEIIGATWAEIDFDGKLWTVPAERMKARREHVVPLPDRAVEILLQCRQRWASNPYIFAGRSWKKPLSNMAFLMCMRRLGHTAVPHGFRSSFRDWAADTGRDHMLAEVALAHVVGTKTQRAYLRSDLLARRRQVMEAWAAYCERPSVAEAVPEVAAAT